MLTLECLECMPWAIRQIELTPGLAMSIMYCIFKVSSTSDLYKITLPIENAEKSTLYGGYYDGHNLFPPFYPR